MLAPLTNQQSHADGTLSDDEYRFLTRRAQDGFGLVETCAAHVTQDGKADWDALKRLIAGPIREAPAADAHSEQMMQDMDLQWLAQQLGNNRNLHQSASREDRCDVRQS